jgi:argininosuccinate lyase
MHESAEEGYSTATDLADWLVRVIGMPFRQAHHATAKMVKLASDANCMLAQLSLEDMKRVEPKITQDIYTVLTVKRSVASRTSFGGTSPVNVKEAVKAAKRKYL